MCLHGALTVSATADYLMRRRTVSHCLHLAFVSCICELVSWNSRCNLLKLPLSVRHLSGCLQNLNRPEDGSVDGPIVFAVLGRIQKGLFHCTVPPSGPFQHLMHPCHVNIFQQTAGCARQSRIVPTSRGSQICHALL